MTNPITPEVEAAIEEVKAAFPGSQVEVTAEPQGGAYVVVHDLWLGETYDPAKSWVGFLIPFLYPRADCYPHFIDAAVRRKKGQSLGVAFSGPTTWNERPAIQVSRRSNQWDASRDTAALKLAKVLEWLRSQL